MKKHDEGYVLAYVTVVLLLFCLIATMILTGSMKNLTAQQDTIQRMQDRYAAEGMIQQVVANWSNHDWDSLESGKALNDMPDVIYMGKNEGYVKLFVTHDSVVITCEVNSNGQYRLFDIGTVPTVEGEVPK